MIKEPSMTDHGHKTVELERRDSIAWITFNRIHALNAINEEMRRTVPPLLSELDADPSVRVIVIRGAGPRSFCVGADLKEQRPTESHAGPRGPVWIEAFAHVAKPTIASIHGFCLGGGLEIALACDLRIASADATFGLPEPARGLIPGGGGTQRLPRLIGLGRALDLLITAERIDAAEAHRLGIVSRLAPSAEVLPQYTERLAARIAALAPLAVRLVKEAARCGIDLELAAGLEMESELFSRVLVTRDRREAAAAFVEKRDPVFTGS
jgi:enoyl-CoA hydratase/carnithine racemase